MEMWEFPARHPFFSIFHFDRGVLVLCPGGLSRLGWVLGSSYGHVLEQAFGVVVRSWLLGLDSFHVLYIVTGSCPQALRLLALPAWGGKRNV